ncbi:uncharacterized protein LOC116135127 [Pistacia vera]|uniref:uncharacterized protein LOC116135127 n=1 Tax=Pistacia vera TaxID=55513 RepID=UPI001263589E|nr:uncharacterized protein LOC116135127 [Pistacia vera]
MNTNGLQGTETDGLQGTKTEVNADGGEGIRTEVKSNVVQDVETEVISRKRNRKGEKQNLGEAGADPHEGVEKFDGSDPSEQNKGDDSKAGATGLQGTITEVNANMFEGTKPEVNASVLQGTQTEVNADGLLGLRTEVNVNGVQDIKTEVVSSKRKLKPKKKKLGEGGDDSKQVVEKFGRSAPSEQNKGDGNQAGSTGLQGTITEGCTNELILPRLTFLIKWRVMSPCNRVIVMVNNMQVQMNQKQQEEMSKGDQK